MGICYFFQCHADRVIIGLPRLLPRGQGQPSRIWKVQCDWLSLGKECCSRFSRNLRGGTKYELPLKLGLMTLTHYDSYTKHTKEGTALTINTD